MKKVVNAIILDKNKRRVLIVQRKLNDSIHAGKWAFPGGLIEENENEEQALIREIKEEVGLEIIEIIKQIGEYEYFRKNNEKTLGKSYLVLTRDLEIRLNIEELENYRFVNLKELKSIELAPGILEEAKKAFSS